MSTFHVKHVMKDETISW